MPQAYLTDRILPSLFRRAREEGKLLEFMDTGFTRQGSRRRGFGIRISPKGTGTWFIRYALDGKHQRKPLGRYGDGIGLADAREAASKILAIVDRGENPDRVNVQPGVPTFGELAKAYIHHVKTRPKPLKNLRQTRQMLIKDLLPAFGHLPANQISRSEFRRLFRQIADRGAPIQANRTQAVVSAIYTWALDHEDLLADVMEYNPVARLKKLGVERPATRSLTWEEVKALWPLWAQYGSTAGLALQLGFLTGQRMNEILRMSWDELEEPGLSSASNNVHHITPTESLAEAMRDGRWWELPGERAKNGNVHRIFLVPTAARIIESTGSGGLRWVFPSPKRPGDPLKDVRKAIAWSSKQAGVEGWTFKTLRTTWATLASEIGIEPWLISEVLNHTVGGLSGGAARVTMVHYVKSKYRHAEQKALAMVRFADRLMLELGEQKPKVLPFSGEAADRR